MFVLVSPIFPAVRVETQFSDFLDGLGPAQLVGRQTLATPAIGKFCLFVKFLISFFIFLPCSILTLSQVVYSFYLFIYIIVYVIDCD